MDDALAIYQDHLDRVSQAVWTADEDALANLLAVPNRMITTDAEILLETVQDVIKAAQDFRAFLIRSGAQEFHRIAREARWHPQHDNRIDGSHDTYVLRGGSFALAPYVNHQVLVREGGVWRGIEIRAEVRNSDCTILSPEQLRARAVQARAGLPTPPPGAERHV
ncbi:hypothetical protein PGB28_03730 [Primorskyibacter aestuariivivens]|uniref:hypothetical protein n=1 Tax=Primorskyibacter aestuariivivens TaxID=1888912 RepID=UPI002301A415|nr:hypothetical protein [Primorskyibacter aestuariivivens]MDA7427557.1 hypothetical protein [Primorskyibacter aestuariivivens]